MRNGRDPEPLLAEDLATPLPNAWATGKNGLGPVPCTPGSPQRAESFAWCTRKCLSEGLRNAGAPYSRFRLRTARRNTSIGRSSPSRASTG